MAIDVEALRNLGMSDADIAQIAAIDSGAWQAEEARINDLVSSRDAAALAAAKASGLSNIDMYVNPIGAGEIIPGLSANIMARLGMYDPKYQAVMRTYGSSNDRDNPIDVTERSTFAVDPTASYRLIDRKSGDVIATASNPAEVAALVEQANSLSTDQGKKASWDLQASTPVAAGDPNAPIKQGWNTVARDDPNTIPLGIKLIGAAMLATTGAGLLQPGGLGGLGAAGGTAGAGTGAGIGAGSSLAGAGLSSLPANLAAIEAGASSALASAGLGATALAPAALAAAAPTLAEAAPIIVTAGGTGAGLTAPLILTGLGAGTAATTLGGTGTSAGTTANNTTTGNATDTSGLQTDAFGNVVDESGSIVATGTGAGGGLNTGAVLGATTAGGATAGLAGGASDAAVSESVQNAVDKAYENAQTGAGSNVADAYAGAGPFVPPPSGGNGVFSKLAGLSTADKLRLAAILASTAGGLFGGKSSTGGGGGTVPAGLGQLSSPLFNQPLTPLTPEQNRSKYGARDMSGTDWATWGSRPATSFFNYVPQPPTGMSRGGDFAVKSRMHPRTEFAVHGPGDGRSDDIPAMLSDGEYVVDAESVALLGNGSRKAGADALDRMRVNLRKHKGKKLAKGEFSLKAKRPEQYLAGGRA